MNTQTKFGTCVAMLLIALAAVPAGSEEAQATTLAVADAPGYVGAWKLSMDFQGRPVEMTLNVVDVGGKIGATIESERQPEPVAVTEAAMTADGLTLTYPMSFGGNDMTLNLVAKLEGEALKGTLSESSGLFTADLTGEKAGAAPAAEAESTVAAKPTELDTIAAQDFVGEWTIAFEVMGNEVEMGLDIMDADGKLAAVIDSEIQPDPAPIEKAEMTDDGLKLSYPMDFGGQALSMTIVAKLQENALVGKIAEASGLFSAEFTGERRSVESGEGATANADGEEGEGRRRGRRGASPTATMKVGDKTINIAFADLKMDAPEADYEKIAGITDGTVFKFVGGRATKLRTDLSLQFGETVVKQGNAAPNYPGVYSMWLKKVGDGWHLVFNEHADIWGTQHEAQADVAEIPLEFAQSETPQESFKIELLPEGDDAGTLKVTWGPMVWTAKFKVLKEEPAA